MISLFAVASLFGFSLTAVLAILLVVERGKRADADLTTRSMAIELARTRADAKAAESVKAIDAATIARLKKQLAATSAAQQEVYARNAEAGAAGADLVIDERIRSMYPDADHYGGSAADRDGQPVPGGSGDAS